MTERYIEFLVDPAGKSPRNLQDSIRRVLNASAGFKQSWLGGDQQDAYETSQEAFEHLDYIQNELLRQRDVLKRDHAAWPTSPFNATLANTVGKILNNVTTTDCAWFLGLPPGQGGMPTGTTPTPLTLEKALNKLKHRDTSALNFSLPASGSHILYLFTNGGMGQPDSISEIDIANFCSACKSAAQHV
ncbi:hypothetical protein [Curvibacter lanceolatus]|uniref:hypothetical protein n=1 Tax=Curvibacter lanceolatus TaxID=86182 RepID=UPI0012FA7F95|nr:hypothetical protein [Curvibacter lanceolatus]